MYVRVGPMKPVKGVKEGHKHNTKENIKAVANQGTFITHTYVHVNEPDTS